MSWRGVQNGETFLEQSKRSSDNVSGRSLAKVGRLGIVAHESSPRTRAKRRVMSSFVVINGKSEAQHEVEQETLTCGFLKIENIALDDIKPPNTG